MNKTQILEVLRAMDSPSGVYVDIEQRHRDADQALLDYIDDDDIREAYGRLEKWYS